MAKERIRHRPAGFRKHYQLCRDRCRIWLYRGDKYACDQSHDRYRAHMHVSTKHVWGPVIELVDLRYRPEVNTIEALAQSDPRKHVHTAARYTIVARSISLDPSATKAPSRVKTVPQRTCVPVLENVEHHDDLAYHKSLFRWHADPPGQGSYSANDRKQYNSRLKQQLANLVPARRETNTQQ